MTVMKRLKTCIKLLHQICGRMTRYFAYENLIGLGPAEIQTMMDNLTCEWQDTLIKGYIQASESGSIWPPAFSLGKPSPLFVSSRMVCTGEVVKMLQGIRHQLERGIKDISARCGSPEVVPRIERFYEELTYAFYDLMQYQNFFH